MSKQITAYVSDDVGERFDEYLDDSGCSKSKAAERAIDEGLRRLGYEPTITDSATLLLHYVRASGATLGIAGFALIGIGLFSTFDYRFLGFNLVLVGVALMLLQRGLSAVEPALSDRIGLSDRLREVVDE